MMGRTKAAHHRGNHQVNARRIVTWARTHPDTRCWRCGHTLGQHTPHANGRPAFWTAGHVVDGIGPLAPEASTCNYSAGAQAGNARRTGTPEPHTERW